ncbi:MAG: carboxymuconolactone decarboxylase family protein [Amylibacter sp.]|nr:carboxymuconolactone decarboxylase family protein [Amylibacter sp.]
MTEFATHTVETAPEGSKAILKAVTEKFKFLPNLIGNMAEAPATVEAYTTLGGIFAKADLSATEQQIIMMTINRLNGCTYCMAAHTTISKMSGVAADVIEALRNNTAIADSKLEALRQFTIVMHDSRGWPKEAQVQAFLAAGYTKQTMLEVVLGISYKTLSNYTNHLAGTQLDAAFSADLWEA